MAKNGHFHIGTRFKYQRVRNNISRKNTDANVTMHIIVNKEINSTT